MGLGKLMKGLGLLLFSLPSGTESREKKHFLSIWKDGARGGGVGSGRLDLG